jgi:hypothetical protein
MRTIVALAALTCLLGLSAAQTMFTGEGYSTSQLAFYNSPISSAFEPNVQKYWGTYIAGAGNTNATSGLMSDMNIWMNTFPLRFNSPLRVGSSSFSANVANNSGLSMNQMNSMLLKRDINTQFSYYQNWNKKPFQSSLNVSDSTGAPAKDSSGLILSQAITSLLNL